MYLSTSIEMTVTGNNFGWGNGLMAKIKELQEEFNTVFSNRNVKLFDSVIPLIVFLITNALVGVEIALWSALGSASGFTVVRIFRKEKLIYSLSGLVGVLLAGGITILSGSESGFFLPGLLSELYPVFILQF